MPLYDIRCENGHISERMIPLRDFEAPIICSCAAPANRVISTPMISVESIYYDCPITGAPITSKRAHEDNLRRHDCRLYEPGETEGNARARAREEAEFDRKVEETVEREIAALPGDKRDQLAKELSAGIDVQVERI